MIDLNKMIETIKDNPNFNKVGMIASHVGIVRSFSRNGEPVSEITVTVDNEKIEKIVQDIRDRPGIVGVIIEAKSGPLAVGDDIMAVVVAGDIRDTVFPALIDAVDRVKTEATRKKEMIKD